MTEYYSNLLQAFIDWTDDEISNGKKFLDWNEVAINWENLDLHWEDIFIIFQRRGGSSARDPENDENYKKYRENNPWVQLKEDLGSENSEKIIKVLCKIKGIDYTKIFENKDNIRVVVNDFVRSKEEIKVKIKL